MEICAIFYNGPTILRYPKGMGYGPDELRYIFGYDTAMVGEVPTTGQILPIGKGYIMLREGGNIPG